MTLTPMHFLIVCPLVALAGFVDSIAGGGGLISLPAYLLTGLPVFSSAVRVQAVRKNPKTAQKRGRIPRVVLT